MAIVKTITANGSKGHHKFSLRVSEDTTSGNSSLMSYSFTIAPIQNGWDWYGFNIPYSVNIGGNTYTGSISSYNGSSTVTLSSGNNIEIPHNTDGTKSISISFSVTDSTGQNYTCGNASASDTMTLTALHKAPTINTATMTETNQAMITLGIPDTTIVPWLSQKRITLSATAYDGATLKYRIRHGFSNYALPSATTFQASNVFNTDYRSNEIEVDQNNKVNILQIVGDNKGAETTDFVLVNISGTNQKPNGIPYFKPTLEKTSTTIKRKSGGGVNLTDNKAVINVKGLIYKGSDLVGNNNSVKQLGYKIWEKGTREPTSYTSLTGTLSGNNVTVSNVIINNIDFTKVYNYKIILKDNYDYSYEIEDSVPTGEPIFTEYKDRVDFKKITVGGKEVIPNEGVGNYAKIKLTTRYTASQSAWQQTKINFTNSSFISSDDGDFTKATYGIICNFDGVVLITKTLSTSATDEIDIAVDGGGDLEVLNTGGYNTYHNYIKTVSSGDLIDITFNSNNTSFAVYEGTQMSIVRIK